jgi:demethylmenaquinone methyltransferase/2-methoxy-6-polyprenyl-1,4-benzoquinol methylase
VWIVPGQDGDVGAYVLMKALESAPSRYEWGIRLLTLGEVDRAYERLVAQVEAGQYVLDVGCGTGALTVRAARRGARVRGMDVSTRMLDQARRNVARCGCADQIELVEMGVAELDCEPAQSYQVVMSGLCLSELTAGERAFALAQAHRLLEPGGLLLLADEVVPRGPARWLLHRLVRSPLALLTRLLAHATTRPLCCLPDEVKRAGFVVESFRLNWLHSFAELAAHRPKERV